MSSDTNLIAQLESILGSENIVTHEEILEKYSRDQSFVPPRRPHVVTLPKTIEEIQEILRFANAEKIPVVPYSSGAIQQGTTIPIMGGIIVDVSRMNRIIDIDEESRTAAIEPGVTFAQLQDEARRYGLRVCTPVGLPHYASVLSSYLEFSPLYSWSKYGTWFLLPMKVVLPSGDVIGTGSWAWEGSSLRGVNPLSFAAGLSRIFLGAQGTLGIATHGRIVLKNLHNMREIYFLPLDRVEEAFRPIHAVLRVSTKGIGEECFVVNRLAFAMLMAKDWPHELEIRNSLPKWTVVLILSGEEGEVKYQREDLEEISNDIEAKFSRKISNGRNNGMGILDEVMYPKGFYKSHKGAYNPIQFYATARLIPHLNSTFDELLKKYDYPNEDANCILLPVEKGRAYYCEYGLNRNPEVEQESRKVQDLWFEVSKSFIQMGAFFDRPYGPWAEMVSQRTTTYCPTLKKFKELLDPNYIMNPGRFI